MQSRRRFLYYLAGGSLGGLGLSWLQTRNTAALDLDTFCLEYPYNSRCEGYLPGEVATDLDEVPYSLERVLAENTAGNRLPAKGLTDLTYLVVTTGPALARYGFSARCPHLGCSVEWQADRQAFVCPCHGSRFDSLGRVSRGPAADPLALVTVTTSGDRIGLLPETPAASPR